jgi:hypothetical protein
MCVDTVVDLPTTPAVFTASGALGSVTSAPVFVRRSGLTSLVGLDVRNGKLTAAAVSFHFE